MDWWASDEPRLMTGSYAPGCWCQIESPQSAGKSASSSTVCVPSRRALELLTLPLVPYVCVCACVLVSTKKPLFLCSYSHRDCVQLGMFSLNLPHK